MDRRAGFVALGNVLGWTVARTWLAILLGAGTIVTFGAYGQRHPLPEYGSGLAIIDEEMRRSHALPRADVLVLGDSASVYGVDAVALEHELAGPRVDSLAVIGPARPPGYAKLLANHLAHQESPRVILLLLHPFGLMHPLDAHKRSEMTAVLNDAWPATSFGEGAVRSLNFYLFGGLLEEPLEGEHGRYYGNGSELRRTLRALRGSLVFPASQALAPPAQIYPGGVRFEIHPDGRRDLALMAEELRDVDRSRIYVGLMPAPSAAVGDATPASRDQVLREVLEILDVPPDHGIDLPASIPDGEFGDLTHVLEPGRVRLTQALAPVVRRVLDAQKP